MSASPAAVASSPTCAIHFDVASVEICGRCGRFCCDACLPDRTTCTECKQLTWEALPRLEGVAKVAAVSWWASGGARVLSALVSMVDLAASGALTPSTLELMHGLANVLNLVPWLPVTIFAYGLWFYRAVIHARERGARNEVGSPFAAVISWYVPLLNFERPFRITRALLASAGLETKIVTAWQLTWCAGGVLSLAMLAPQESVSLAVGVVAELLLGAADFTGASIARRLKWPTTGQAPAGQR